MSHSQNPQPDPDDMRRLFEQFLSDADKNPAMAEAMKAFDLNLSGDAISSLAGQLAAMFGAAPTDGLNLELSTDMARKTVAAAGDSVVDEKQRKGVVDAVSVANLWLDEVTSISAADLSAVSLSRAEWVEKTMPTWGKVVGPVALAVNQAMTSALRGQLGEFTERMGSGDMPELPGMPGMPGGMPAGMPDLSQLPPGLDQLPPGLDGVDLSQLDFGGNDARFAAQHNVGHNRAMGKGSDPLDPHAGFLFVIDADDPRMQPSLHDPPGKGQRCDAIGHRQHDHRLGLRQLPYPQGQPGDDSKRSLVADD